MGAEAEIRSYYDAIYQQPKALFARSRAFHERIADLLGPEAGSRLLDLGCGAGGFLRVLQQRGVQGYGIDISAQALRCAEQFVPAERLHCGKMEQLPYAGDEFDHVVSLGSLEHAMDLGLATCEVRRVAKSGAACLFVVPNRRFVGYVLTPRKGTGQIQERLMTLEEWRAHFERYGFIVEAVGKDPGPSVLRDRKPLGVLRRLALKVSVLLPLDWTYQFVIRATLKR